MNYRATTPTLLPGQIDTLQVTPQEPGTTFYVEVTRAIEEGSRFDIRDVAVGMRSQFIAPGGSLAASMFSQGLRCELFDGCAFPLSFSFRERNAGRTPGRLTMELGGRSDAVRGDLDSRILAEIEADAVALEDDAWTVESSDGSVAHALVQRGNAIMQRAEPFLQIRTRPLRCGRSRRLSTAHLCCEPTPSSTGRARSCREPLSLL